MYLVSSAFKDNTWMISRYDCCHPAELIIADFYVLLLLQQKVYVCGGQKEEEPLEMTVYNEGMFKTELCNKWQETGSCPYNDHCQFAHGIGELRPVIRHPRYKTEVCRMVLAGVVCPYGHRCHFRHALTEQEKAISQPKPRSMKLERWDSLMELLVRLKT